MTTVLSSTFDDDFKAYMTYTTSSTNTAYKVTVTSSGVYIACSWAEYPWKTTLSATGYDTRTGTLGTARRTKGYHGVITTDKTYSWTRKTSAYTVKITVTTKKNTSDTSTGTKSVTFTVPALTKYTITYNANGGSGAPSATTKYYGIDVKVSSTTPTRTGYTFQGWSVPGRDYTDVYYSPGGNVAYNGNQTLVAVWKANKYTITFDANGGVSGSTKSIQKTYGQAATLVTTANPTRQYYKFLGWSTSKTATTATWAAGASYTTNITANTTLYAVWKEDYIPGTVKITAKRTDSDGYDNDEGTYAVATVTWTKGTLSGSEVTPTSIVVYCCERGTDNWTSVYTASTSTSSPFTTDVFQNGTSALDQEKQYDIKVVITDSQNGSNPTVRTTFISKAEFVIDVNEDGTGIAIGAACSRAGFSTAWNTYIDNGKAYYGTFTDGTVGSLAYINPSDNTVFGYGGYNLSKGRTNVYGNAMSLNSKAEINISSPTAGLTNRAYGVNKVLWSGAYYMTASHTATLSDAISAQPHGITLVFSAYIDGETKDYDFVCFYIPKHLVSIMSSKPHTFHMTSSKHARIATKHLNVYDAKIVGTADNNASGTKNGVTYDNASFVLRYVIGL